MNLIRARVTVLSAAVMAAVSVGSAQAPTFKRTVLQQGDLSAAGREAVQAIAELPATVQTGRHSHPGEEVAYLLEGAIVLEVEGKPAANLKAGDFFLIPAGRIHNARNTGSGAAKVLATYIIEKGKPLATPAP